MQRASDLTSERAVIPGRNDRIDRAVVVMRDRLDSQPAEFLARGLAEAPPTARVGIDRQQDAHEFRGGVRAEARI